MKTTPLLGRRVSLSPLWIVPRITMNNHVSGMNTSSRKLTLLSISKIYKKDPIGSGRNSYWYLVNMIHIARTPHIFHHVIITTFNKRVNNYFENLNKLSHKPPISM
jgi:hypothetical protein